MGYRVHTFSPDSDTPTGQVADVEVVAPYADGDALRAFAKQVSVVTFEFENVPSSATEVLESLVPVRPSAQALHVSQQRAREKRFLAARGLPTVPFEVATTEAELSDALGRVGTPAVVKTAAFGYDGKGQMNAARPTDALAIWQALGGRELVVEKRISLQAELSVIAARGLDGQMVQYPLFENRHANHILDLTTAPALVPQTVVTQATEIGRTILEALDYVGVLCIEFFLSTDGELMVNELAPRPHNSGHLTFDAAVTSQFEQQVRAVCGLPLGSTELRQPAAMANLLGHLWESGEPNWADALEDPAVKLHLYGKRESRVGRKMGHLTATAPTTEEAVRRVREARERLGRR
jgi:5-(carboxyamino)imidazole ribonucleotide synthase